MDEISNADSLSISSCYSQNLIGSSKGSSLLVRARDGVDAKDQFVIAAAWPIQEKVPTNEVKLSHFAKNGDNCVEDDVEDEFFEELEEDMIDEGVTTIAMSNFEQKT